MAKARALDRRRKSVRNIRKITRTMELVATAQFRRAMERAISADAFTRRLSSLVADLGKAGLEITHPLLLDRPDQENSILLVLTANRGMCGGYNAGVMRVATQRMNELNEKLNLRLEVSGKRGISAFKFRSVKMDETFTQFEDKPTFEQVRDIANRYLDDYLTGKIDRVDIAYMKFVSLGKQFPVVETLLPMAGLNIPEPTSKKAPYWEQNEDDGTEKSDMQLKREAQIRAAAASVKGSDVSKALDDRFTSHIPFEFLPSAKSILEEVVPQAFRLRMFKAFLDAAVGEQIARMTAMKAATENATKMIGNLTMHYNRARQSQITSEINEIVGGADALGG